jgi:hypothetical protein
MYQIDISTLYRLFDQFGLVGQSRHESLVQHEHELGSNKPLLNKRFLSQHVGPLLSPTTRG